MTQKAVGIDECSGKEAIAILVRHDLAAMEMAGEDEIKSIVPGSLPDARVVRAQDPDIAGHVRRGART